MASWIEILVYAFIYITVTVVVVGLISSIMYFWYKYTKKKLERRYTEENDIGRKSQTDHPSITGGEQSFERTDAIDGGDFTTPERGLLQGNNAPLPEEHLREHGKDSDNNEQQEPVKLNLFSFK